MLIGEFLREKRNVRGMSVRAVAARAGIAFTSVSRIERGQQNPPFDVLHRLLQALEVSWTEFTAATGYAKLDPVTEKVMLLMADMTDEQKREILRSLESAKRPKKPKPDGGKKAG